jgi:hypothetical protein
MSKNHAKILKTPRSFIVIFVQMKSKSNMLYKYSKIAPYLHNKYYIYYKL